MAVHHWYGQAAVGQFGATAARRIDWVNDPITAALLANTHTPDMDNHAFWDDISADEVAAGDGYTAGGETLTGKSVVYIPASKTTALRAATTVWAELTKTFRYLALYKNTGTPATSPLHSLVDFETDQSPVAEDFAAIWDSLLGALKAVTPQT